jgi:hypothetical protein
MLLQSPLRVALIALVALVAVAACSTQDAERAATPQPSTRADAGGQQPPTCTLVAPTELSAIVGAQMSVDDESSLGKTTCRYRSAAGGTIQLEIRIDWGNGAAGMMGAGLVGRREPDRSDPLSGLGDQAAVFGQSVWVRLGDDLVILEFPGIDDTNVETARRIVDVIRPRMGPSAQA